MRAAAEATWGAPTLAGRTVGVAGVGKVGRHLVEHLLEDGAEVVVTDVYAAGRRAARWRPTPRCAAVADTDALVAAPTRRLRPVRARRRPHRRGRRDAAGPGRLRRRQQPARPPRAWRSSSPTAASSTRPTTCVNAGGLIQVADELHGFDFERARSRATLIFDTTREVFALAEAEGVPPAVAADRLAEQRMADAARADGDRGIWLP